MRGERGKGERMKKNVRGREDKGEGRGEEDEESWERVRGRKKVKGEKQMRREK